jgi:hypothetical protein
MVRIVVRVSIKKIWDRLLAEKRRVTRLVNKSQGVLRENGNNYCL